MSTLLIALLLSIRAPAESLALVQTQYAMPRSAPSCGLLHQRQLEREKDMRELEQLIATLKTDERALVPLDCLLTNKWFMPQDTWVDDAVEVAVTVKVSAAMQAEIENLGLKNVFIRTQAPGFVWQSLAGQLPEEVSIIQDGNLLDIRYKTYLNATCQKPLAEPVVEWVPQADMPGLVNSFDLLTKLGQSR